MRFNSLKVLVRPLVLLALFVPAVLLKFPAPAGAASPPIEGPMIKFVASNPPVPVPDIPFIGARGKTIKLADYNGRMVLLNFWATWCSPCIRELPSLQALGTSIDDDRFAVQLVSIDRGGAGVFGPFLEKLGITGITSAADPKAALLRAFKAPGIPISVLISPDGLVLGRLIGDADWNSPAARALIKFYLDQGPRGS